MFLLSFGSALAIFTFCQEILEIRKSKKRFEKWKKSRDYDTATEWLKDDKTKEVISLIYFSIFQTTCVDHCSKFSDIKFKIKYHAKVLELYLFLIFACFC